jgi:basic amino acid/polyamine antiporter, APA family
MTLPPNASSHKLGPWTATALVVGNIIGVGVFTLPASLAPYGWGSLLGWALTLVGALCLAWVFALLARHLPEGGGAIGVVRRAFGPEIGFLTAWGYWISVWVANAVIAIGGVSYLGRLLSPIEHSRPLAGAIGLAVLWILTAINLRGPRAAGVLQLITTLLKLWPFLATFFVAIMLVLASAPAPVQPFDRAQFSFSAATATATLTLYAMIGIESAAVPASAVENPTVTVPRATMAGTMLSGLLNMLLSMSLVALMPRAQLSASSAPLVDFLSGRLGSVPVALVSVAVVISAFGCLNGWVLLSGETAAGLAESGDLPAWWGRRNERGAAVTSLLVSSTLTSVLLVVNASGRFENVWTFAMLLSTATSLVLYLLIPLAALQFAARGLLPRTTGLRITAIGAALFALWALAGAGRDALIWGAVLMAAGWPLYRLVQRRRAVAA